LVIPVRWEGREYLPIELNSLPVGVLSLKPLLLE